MVDRLWHRMLKSKRRRLLAIVALAGLIIWLGSSALVAWKFTRRSGAPFPEPPPQVAWAKVEAHRLETSDGQEIGAWLVRGDPQKGCVLLLHGNGDSRRQMLPVMQCLAEAHFTVLAISLRAHGDSTGEINDFGWSARHDVAAAVDFLRTGVSAAARLHRGPFAGGSGGDLRGRGAEGTSRRATSWSSPTRTSRARRGTGCNTTCPRSWTGSPTAACGCGPLSSCRSIPISSRPTTTSKTFPRACRW